MSDSESDAPEGAETPPIPPRKVILVRNVIDSAQLTKDIDYNLVDLNAAMQQQAQLALHYGIQAAVATKQLDDLKLALDVAEGKAYRLLRDKALAEGGKVTEDYLKRQVTIHRKVVEIRQAINAAKQIEAIAKTATEAFKQRKDMLVQHAARDRSELEGELRIRSREDASDLHTKRVAAAARAREALSNE